MLKFVLGAMALAFGCAPAAIADTVTVGSTYSGNFYMDVNGTAGLYGGGNVGGSSGVIAGVDTYFAEFYCVDIFSEATLNTTYSSLYNKTGTIGNNTLAAAGQIAWLITNIAPTLTSQDQFQGLQGLIWSLETPSQVAFDTAHNSAAAGAAYQSDLAALGNNTEAVSNVWWINPTNSDGVYAYQGFVAATSSQVPEPASFAVLGAGLLGLTGLRRRKSLKPAAAIA